MAATRGRGDVEALAHVPVWDAPVRIVHWLMVVVLAVLVTSGLVGEDYLVWHMRAGYVMLTLVLFRIIWGFCGSRNARFGAFVRGPGAIARYAATLRAGAPVRHATHNPLGALMVIALLAVLLAQCTLGLFTSSDSFDAGPLARRVSEDLSQSLSWWHRRVWWLVLALVAVHITAVVAYFALLRDDLVRPMFTGRKRMPPGEAAPARAHASLRLALAIGACAAAVVAFIATR